jgi:hypothetical protein
MKLMEDVRETLSLLTELIQRQREAIGSAPENTILAIDREIENKLGEKERRMGALKQHRTEHGC